MSRESTEVAVPVEAAPDDTANANPVEQLYRELESYLRASRPNEDFSGLEKAFRFAAQRHGAQKRVSGEPYMVHPLIVTRLLAEMNMDLTCLQTGLLHDVVEDTGATIEEIRKNFGEDVARCVD
jgi:GTP pyrophosphokinase